MSELTEDERAQAIKNLEQEVAEQSNAEPTYIELDDIFDFEIVDDIDRDPNYEEAPSKQKKKKATATTTKKAREYDMKVAVCKSMRQYPPIYQITHKNYSVKPIKDQMWRKISAEVTEAIGRVVPVRECQKLWEALRESTR